jgi:hypothetical protein
VRVIVESLPPSPPPSDEEKAEKVREKRFKWGKVILELLALLGLFLYVRETSRTNDLTQQALEDERSHFDQMQRPWVGPSEPIVISKLVNAPHRMLEITARVKNFGISPASNVVPVVNFVLGGRGTDIRPEIDKACAQIETNILPLKVGDMLFPGDAFSFPTEVNSIADTGQTDSMYFFPGCIIYIDRRNQVHHTKICQWTDREHLKAGATLSSCSRQYAD